MQNVTRHDAFMAKTNGMVDEPPTMDKPEGPSPAGMGEDEVEEAEWDNTRRRVQRRRLHDKRYCRWIPLFHNEDVDK